MSDPPIPPDSTPPWVKEQREPTREEFDAWLCDGLSIEAEPSELVQPGLEDEYGRDEPGKDPSVVPPKPEPNPKSDASPTPQAVSGTTNPRDLLERLYSMLGTATLLAIPLKEKKPVSTGWPKLTYKDTQKAEYQRMLEHTIKQGGNIGVLLGPASGYLFTIDVDDDQLAEEFLAHNPTLAQTLRSRGRRGFQLWVRPKPESDYPKSKAVYDLKTTDGKKYGEWRCGGSRGAQSVIFGVHPGGMRYEILVEKPPLEIEFRWLQWLGPPPSDTDEPQQQEQKEGRPQQTLAAGDERLQEEDLVRTLIERHGIPLYKSRKDRPGTLNEPFWAALYAAENHVLYEPRENRFYQYEDKDGLYHPLSEHQLLTRLEERMLKAARTWPGFSKLQLFRGARQLGGIVSHLKGRVEREDAFGANRDLIHVANGVLDLSGETIRLLPFSPDLQACNGVPIAYDPKATCPQFESKLLILIEPDDRELLLKFFGQFLTGYNSTQRILILEGLPETGKSTTAEIAKLLVGPRNCAELRTKHLEGRFEIGRLWRRTLVIGADVPVWFLNQEGSYRLKSIVGGDLLDAEKKSSNVYFSMLGAFNVLLTANARLRVCLEGDRGAWERRLAIIRYAKPRTGNRINNFGQKLIKEEGSGILNLALEGLRKLRADLKEQGDIKLTEAQRKLVKSFLDESDGLRLFLKHSVQTKEGGNLTTAEIIERFAIYCSEHGWGMSSTTAERQLPDLMMELFNVSKSNNIEREGALKADGQRETRQLRGFRGVTFRADDDEDAS
jgi:P4 family phage/plasmid primase-like protien